MHLNVRAEPDPEHHFGNCKFSYRVSGMREKELEIQVIIVSRFVLGIG